MKKRATGNINKKDILVKEREDKWYVAPSGGIPEYSAEKDPHCPTGQIRKFNEEKKLKAQILAKRDKATSTFIKTTLDHSMEEIKLDMEGGFGKQGKDAKSKVKTSESFAEIEILQKIVVRENLLAELQKLLRSQNDVSACLAEVVELVKAMRFQTLDIVEDIHAWQQSLARPQPFQYKGFNYLVKIKADLDFLDLYEEVVEKFCFEFRSNPLAYRGGGNVISGYGYDTKKKLYSQGLLQSYYSEADGDFLDGLEVSRLLSAEKVIQSEFNRIAKEKLAGQHVAQLQQQSAGGDVLDRDIFNSLSKSATSLPDIGAAEGDAYNGDDTQPNTTDSTGFKVGNKNKKGRKGPKTTVTINPKKIKEERIAALTEEASELKGMMVNVDEKIQFLTNHHLDLLNQRAAMDTRMKEAKAMSREVAAQHIAAEISVNSAAIIENSAKIKDLQRESYFVNLERKRKLGTAQKLREEIEEAKRRAALQKKIEAKIKKEGLLAALQSFNTKATVEEIATLGDKALGKRPTSASAALRQGSSSPPRSGNRAKRDGSKKDGGAGAKDNTNQMRASESLPALGQTSASDWALTSLSAEETSPGAAAAAFPALLESEEEYEEDYADAQPSLLQRVAHPAYDLAAELDQEAQSEMPESAPAEAEEPGAEVQQGSLSAARAPIIRLEDYDEDLGADEYDVREQHEDDGEEEEEEDGDEENDGEEEEEGEEENEEGNGEGEQSRWDEQEQGGEYAQYGEVQHGEDAGNAQHYYGQDNQYAGETHQYYGNGQSWQSDQAMSGASLENQGHTNNPWGVPAIDTRQTSTRSHYDQQPSPSDASLDGSHLSPLGYTYPSVAEGDAGVWTAEPAAQYNDGNNAAVSKLPRKTSQNEMYISDDEDGHEHDHFHDRAQTESEHSPLAYTTYTEGSPFADFAESPERAPAHNSNSRAKSGVSDMTISPMSMGSPSGFHQTSDSYISDGSPEPRTAEKGSQALETYERADSAPQRDPAQQLFLDGEAEGAEYDAAAAGVLVGADGEVDYPAGGAYALVKSLKLSPRPNM